MEEQRHGGYLSLTHQRENAGGGRENRPANWCATLTFAQLTGFGKRFRALANRWRGDGDCNLGSPQSQFATNFSVNIRLTISDIILNCLENKQVPQERL